MALDRIDKAFSFALEQTKQLITLATAVITISVSLLGNVLDELAGGSMAWLRTAWLAFLLSIVFGVWSIAAMTGALASTPQLWTAAPEAPSEGEAGGGDRATEPHLFAFSIVLPSSLHVVSFLLGLVCTIIFGWTAT